MKTVGFFLATTLLLTANLLSAENNERWKTQRLWREKIERGLSEQEVMAVLGKPLYVQRSSGKTIMFYQQFVPVTAGIEKKKATWIGNLCFLNYGTVELSSDIKEEKPQKAKQAQEEKQKDILQAGKQVKQQGSAAKRKGEYYDERDPRKIEMERKRNNDDPSKPIHKVVEWVEPDWDNVGKQYSDFSFPDKETVNLENWKDPLMWKRLRLNLPEESIRKMMGEPSSQNKGVQSSSTEKEQEWLRYGDGHFGGVLYFQYDLKKAKYMLSSWSEPYWPEIVKQIPKINPRPVEPNTPQGTDKVNTKI